METPLSDRCAALSAAAVITLALLQSVALLGHPRPVEARQLAQAGCTAAQVR